MFSNENCQIVTTFCLHHTMKTLNDLMFSFANVNLLFAIVRFCVNDMT